MYGCPLSCKYPRAELFTLNPNTRDSWGGDSQSSHFLFVIGWQTIIGIVQDIISDVHETSIQLFASCDSCQHLGGVACWVVNQTDTTGINGTKPFGNVEAAGRGDVVLFYDHLQRGHLLMVLIVVVVVVYSSNILSTCAFIMIIGKHVK